MRSPRAFAIAAFVAVLLAAPRAEARFGKRSDSGGSSSNPSEHKASSASSSQHKAVRADAPSSDSYSSAPPSNHANVAPGMPIAYPIYERHYYYGWGFGYLPYYFYTPPPPGSPVEEVRADAQPSGPSATIGISAQGHSQGATLGLGFAIEGDRVGFNTELQAVYAREPGAVEVDTIKLVDMHLTYAVVRGDHGRVRLEGGFDWAISPDAAFFGPDAGVSAAMGLVGGFGLEAAVHYAPVPHQRVDWNAGVAWALGPLGFRGGLRFLYLDDRALLDWDGNGDGKPDRNTDTFFGPYFGVGLVF